MDKVELLSALVGTQTSNLCAFVRIAKNDPVLAKQVLDMGVDGVIFPMVLNAEDAKMAVASCRYPPTGIRGFGPSRAAYYGSIDMKEYIHEISKKVLVIIQIEDIEAIRNLDDILAVPGIGALVLGPCDLSASLGLLGEINHPEVRKAMETFVEKSKKAKIPFGVSMGYNDEAVRYWAGKGPNFIFTSNEVDYILSGSKYNLKRLNAALAEAKN